MDQAGDETHETDIPHDYETRPDVEDQMGQADDETHHKTDKMYHDASRYTTLYNGRWQHNEQSSNRPTEEKVGRRAGQAGPGHG